jgi:putative FmdB family regulatory protein
MPLYEYKCESCGSVFEKMQKFSDDPVTVHEGCGGHVRKLMSAPAFQFKGTGWYVTDYGKGGKKPEANGDSKPASDKKTESSEAKSESSKSESKGESSNSDSKSESSKSDSSKSESSSSKPAAPAAASSTSTSSEK